MRKLRFMRCFKNNYEDTNFFKNIRKLLKHLETKNEDKKNCLIILIGCIFNANIL